MYVTLYKNNPNTIFTPPSATPSLSNYNTTAEGSRGSIWKCLRNQDNLGDGEWIGYQENPGGPINECPSGQPTGACTIGDKCFDIDPILGTIYYVCEQETPTYTYYWDLLVDGMPEIIYGGIIRNAKEDITRRVYDKDTSKFEGLSDELLDEPLVFVAKEDDDTYIYSGYVNSWSQNDKLVTFKGIDFKSIFDTEIKLDFYADMISVNLQVITILNKVFNNFSNNHPGLNLTIPTITTDTAYISNLLGQVFTTNALKFLKVYLVTFGLFIIPVFNEITKEIDVSIETNNQSETIRLDDFVFESTKTDTKINKCIATLNVKSDQEDTKLYKWLPTSEAYYNQQSADMKSEEDGVTINSDTFVVLTPSDAIINNISGDYYLEIRINNANLQKIAAWSGTGTPIYWFWIPYSDYFIFSARVDRAAASKSRIGVGALSTMTDVLIETAKYPENPAGGKNLYLQEHDYNDFGQGWFEAYINNITLPTSTYIRIRIALKEEPPVGFIDTIIGKTIIANPEVIGSRQDYRTYLTPTIQEQTWYLRPTVTIPEDGSMPYGYAVKTTDGSITKYWQLGQVPREPKNIPEKAFYLGKDNQVYEEYIAPANQIYPVQTKIYAEEFFYKAQFNAIYELVNSRYNENVIIPDNKVLNPIELANLGLNAQVTVYDKMNNVATLPISEIQIKNGEKKVKLGFKKTRFTEVIKS